MRVSNGYSAKSVNLAQLGSICPIEAEDLDITLVVSTQDANEIAAVTINRRFNVDFEGLAADIAELLNGAGHGQTDLWHPAYLAHINVRPIQSAAIRLPGPGGHDTFRGLWSNQRNEL